MKLQQIADAGVGTVDWPAWLLLPSILSTAMAPSSSRAVAAAAAVATLAVWMAGSVAAGVEVEVDAGGSSTPPTAPPTAAAATLAPCNLTAVASVRMSAARAVAYTAAGDAPLCASEAGVRRMHAGAATLAYVTPWHRGGYAAAVTWGAKFTLLSPVWLQVRDAAGGGRGGGGARVELAGTHDIDAGWLAELEGACAARGAHAACPQVVPRVMWEATARDVRARAAAVTALRDAAVAHSFDGYVLEVGGGASADMAAFVRAVAAAMAALPPTPRGPRRTILVLPPAIAPLGRANSDVITAAALRDFAAAGVDYFSLTGCDARGRRGAGGGAPPPAAGARGVTPPAAGGPGGGGGGGAAPCGGVGGGAPFLGGGGGGGGGGGYMHHRRTLQPFIPILQVRQP